MNSQSIGFRCPNLVLEAAARSAQTNTLQPLGLGENHSSLNPCCGACKKDSSKNNSDHVRSPAFQHIHHFIGFRTLQGFHASTWIPSIPFSETFNMDPSQSRQSSTSRHFQGCYVNNWRATLSPTLLHSPPISSLPVEHPVMEISLPVKPWLITVLDSACLDDRLRRATREGRKRAAREGVWSEALQGPQRRSPVTAGFGSRIRCGTAVKLLRSYSFLHTSSYIASLKNNILQ